MFLVPIHDMHIGTERKNVKKWLSKIGESRLRDLIAVKRADKLAQNPEKTGEELNNLAVTEAVLNSIITDGEPFTVKDLAVNGNDIKELGFEGREIGEILSYLLERVVSDELNNDKETLLSAIKNSL